MKNIKVILTFVIISTIIFAIIRNINAKEKYGMCNASLVTGAQMRFLSILDDGSQLEDVGMRVSYQLARRSVVRLTVKNSAGSGLVWKIDDDGIIIVSNRHILMNDVKASVVFLGNESAQADIIGYSQQYDIGFARVESDSVTDAMLRNIYEAVPAEYEIDADADEREGRAVLQMGADMGDGDERCFTGSTLGISYEPLFNTEVIRSACYAKAGMSGGGLFDSSGRLLGMLSGGDVADDAQVKEADVSFSLPVSLIEAEWEEIANQ